MIQINTILLNATTAGIKKSAKILQNGGIVAIPTETVYGLAANALDAVAVQKIFIAKGRAQDNPLIVHISALSMLPDLITELPPKAQQLANAFWPGPLTIVLKKSALIPDVVSCGLDTVGIRMPSNTTARAVISECGFPLAAPSANISGGVSPTTAEHCIEDLTGKIDAVLDGGKCTVGLESTVISLVNDIPLLLRPGFVTAADIENVIGKIEIAAAITSQINEEKPASPGMKYKHYSPLAEVILINGSSAQYIDYVNQSGGFALCYDEDMKDLLVPYISLGSKDDHTAQASSLFYCLRELDKLGAVKVFAHCPDQQGVGMAIYNRLLRAANFQIITL